MAYARHKLCQVALLHRKAVLARLQLAEFQYLLHQLPKPLRTVVHKPHLLPVALAEGVAPQQALNRACEQCYGRLQLVGDVGDELHALLVHALVLLVLHALHLHFVLFHHSLPVAQKQQCDHGNNHQPVERHGIPFHPERLAHHHRHLVGRAVVPCLSVQSCPHHYGVFPWGHLAERDVVQSYGMPFAAFPLYHIRILHPSGQRDVVYAVVYAEVVLAVVEPVDAFVVGFDGLWLVGVVGVEVAALVDVETRMVALVAQFVEREAADAFERRDVELA